MTFFSLNETDVLPLLAAVTGAELDLPEARDVFARSVWTGLAEPGDRIAGTLIASLGAATTLDLLIAGVDATAVRASLDSEKTGSTSDSTALSEEDLETALNRWKPRLESQGAVRALLQASRFGARLIIPGHPLWPAGLFDLEYHAPLALWVRGRDEALAALENSIALVGARAATGYGEHVTMEASAGLVDRGLAIVSGAAYGIDGMAHRAALASSGQTIAFLAGGIDRFYPSGHDALLTRIVEAGAVISELPCGAPPTKWRFLQRNRLIAAVSQATVVLEAGWRSGSLNTANHASSLDRPLGAVPGPVTSAASAGCHRLIRDSQATLVTNPDEMAELMPHRELVTQPHVRESLSASFHSSTPRTSSENTRLLDAMSARSPRTSTDLAQRAGFAVGEVQALLGTLELDGLVIERDRGWVVTPPKR
jgi:DNA processing protein